MPLTDTPSARKQDEEHIRRLRRLGGVELGRVEPEERDALAADVRAGYAHHKKAVIRFRCPVCGNVARNDQDMEPLCTGPNWTDDHEPTVMERLSDSVPSG